MKKTKTIYIMILVICTVAFVTTIGSVGILATTHVVEESSLKELKLNSQNACLEFNATINSIEQCVNTLSSAAIYHMNDFERFKTDDNYVNEYTEELRNLILYSANNTKGALSIYIRYNPEFTDPNSGLFFVWNEKTQDFAPYKVTDFSTAPKEELVWYDIPVENGKATWMEPYENNYIDCDMISYVVPYYIQGELVGIIGMDINYEYLKELINSITVYETGHAFLVNKQGKVIVHKDYELYHSLLLPEEISHAKKCVSGDMVQYEYSNKEKTTVYSETKNNMFLCVTAPNAEIYKASHDLINKTILLGVLSFVIILIISTIIIRKLFLLSETDELTGIYNRKYFIQAYQEKKKGNLANYSLFLFDIDHFKGVNDTYGHNIGDQAIVNVATTAKKILGKQSVIARWGGDEFIGLIPASRARDLLETLRTTVASHEDNIYGSVTLSIGLTTINPELNFTEISEKADMALYTSKLSGRNRITSLET